MGDSFFASTALAEGGRRKNNSATYVVLEVVKEILPEGAKNFAPAYGKEPSRLVLFIRAIHHRRVVYIKAAQLVGEGLATKPQHLCGSRGVAALARQGFGQKLSLHVHHYLFEVDGL